MNQQPATNLKCLIRLLSMIFPIMKQYYLLLVKNLNHHTKVILMEKIQSMYVPLIAGIKCKICSAHF